MIKPRSVFMLINHNPQDSSAARERLDLALLLAASDWPLTLAFTGAGVLHLQAPASSAPLRDFAAALGSLELFGAEKILVEGAALERYAIAAATLRVPADVTTAAAIVQVARSQDLIV